MGIAILTHIPEYPISSGRVYGIEKSDTLMTRPPKPGTAAANSSSEKRCL